MNKIMLLGRLTKDVEVKKFNKDEERGDLLVGRYTLAVNRSYKRKGEQDADFINIVAFGKLAEFAEKYFKKGQQIAIVGRLQIRQFDGEDGNRQYFTEVIAEEQHFAEGKREID